jgi:hypothetical protein
VAPSNATSFNRWSSLAAILISLAALAVSIISVKIAYDTKQAQFKVDFSIECDFGKERGYILSEHEIAMPVICGVTNLSSKPITIVDFASRISPTSDDHTSASFDLKLDATDSESMKFNLQPSDVQDIKMIATVEASKAVLLGCKEQNNMTAFELIDCSDEEVVGISGALNKLSTFDLDNPAVDVEFTASDGTVRAGKLSFPYGAFGGV